MPVSLAISIRHDAMLTGILDDLAGGLELLQRDLALVWEHQNIPVLVAHSGNFSRRANYML